MCTSFTQAQNTRVSSSVNHTTTVTYIPRLAIQIPGDETKKINNLPDLLRLAIIYIPYQHNQ